MAWWTVSTLDKKSCEEREIWKKDEQTIIRVNGFRWGTFSVETTDDNPPDGITAGNPGEGVNMYDLNGDNINQVDLISMDDGWYGDFEFEGVDDEQQQELIDAMEDDYYEYLESNGWYNDETEAWVYGPLSIEKDAE